MEQDSVGEISGLKKSVGENYVGEDSVGEISCRQGENAAGKKSMGRITWVRIISTRFPWNFPGWQLCGWDAVVENFQVENWDWIWLDRNCAGKLIWVNISSVWVKFLSLRTTWIISVVKISFGESWYVRGWDLRGSKLFKNPLNFFEFLRTLYIKSVMKIR